MSLIHDAMKVAQRERDGRSQAGKEPQPLDGFFPYVSSSSSRARSRRTPLIIVSAGAVVLLGVVAWLMWPKDSVAPNAKRPPIILPPPVTVAKTPPAVDSTTAANGRAEAPVVTSSEQRESSATPDRSRSASRSQTTSPRVESGAVSPSPSPSATTGAATAAVEPQREQAAVQPQRTIVPRIDYEARATALFNAGDLAGAKENFALATRHAPNARAWTNYGVTLQRLGDNAGAAAAYQSAVGIDANYLEAWLYQGRLAAEQGDVTRAVPLFERARAINPRNAEVNVELARLEYDAKNWVEAKRFAEEALRGDATNIRAYWYLAVASDPLKDVDASIRGYSGYLQYVGDAPDQARFIGWARTRLADLRGKP